MDPASPSVLFACAFRGFYFVSPMGLKGFSGPSEPPASPPHTHLGPFHRFPDPLPHSPPVSFDSLSQTLSLSASSPNTLTRLRSPEEGIWRKNERNTGFLSQKHPNCHT
ncbi:hypothetical protein NPIL_31741 [Nephila pilipes]|uniref:Uncharacterized protein n=1 Tax=Nephila pilipes TaxID=299642 RepID=A0A8X6NA12_NEPPI|nr:hypothetical protein NPIL_31741 [Nephila pilipes]